MVKQRVLVVAVGLRKRQLLQGSALAFGATIVPEAAALAGITACGGGAVEGILIAAHPDLDLTGAVNDVTGNAEAFIDYFN